MPSRTTGLSRSGLPGRTRRKRAAARRRAERRKADEFARKYHSIERVLFVQYAGPCAVPGCASQPENAHLDGEGMGRKGHYTRTVRLCRGHHRTRAGSLHNLGSAAAFDRRHGTDLEGAARALERDWQERGEAWVAEQRASGAYDAMRRAA
jgi:hypothetical protein